jgi:hypothetical protein
LLADASCRTKRQGGHPFDHKPQLACPLRASRPVDGQLDLRTASASLAAAEASNVGAGINSRQSMMGDFSADAFVATHL